MEAWLLSFFFPPQYSVSMVKCQTRGASKLLNHGVGVYGSAGLTSLGNNVV